MESLFETRTTAWRMEDLTELILRHEWSEPGGLGFLEVWGPSESFPVYPVGDPVWSESHKPERPSEGLSPPT